MVLYLNTVKEDSSKIEIKLAKGNIIVAKKVVGAKARQSEKLISAIDSVLKQAGAGLNKIKRIQVENSGGSFTALRIGIATANALAYSLKIPVEGKNGTKIKNKHDFDIVKPIYDKDPNITISVKNILP